MYATENDKINKKSGSSYQTFKIIRERKYWYAGQQEQVVFSAILALSCSTISFWSMSNKVHIFKNKKDFWHRQLSIKLDLCNF
jgi:hypothetical protein